MKKPRKKPKPELRVRISEGVFRALKLAVARSSDFSAAEFVEHALSVYPPIKREQENL